MPVISSEKDTEALTMTIIAEFPVSVERAWQLFADPRQLERWWGPPTWPATFETHEFVEGGKAGYYMQGPEGDKSRGWWRFTQIDAPRSIVLEDGFADENGEPSTEFAPMVLRVDFSATEDGARMSIVTQFTSLEQLQQMIEMGMQEGMSAAMGQIDAVLAG